MVKNQADISSGPHRAQEASWRAMNKQVVWSLAHAPSFIQMGTMCRSLKTSETYLAAYLFSKTLFRDHGFGTVDSVDQ